MHSCASSCAPYLTYLNIEKKKFSYSNFRFKIIKSLK